MRHIILNKVEVKGYKESQKKYLTIQNIEGHQTLKYKFVLFYSKCHNKTLNHNSIIVFLSHFL